MSSYRAMYDAKLRSSDKRELIKEFLKDLKDFELKRYSDMIRMIKNIRKKWQNRSKYSNY